MIKRLFSLLIHPFYRAPDFVLIKPQGIYLRRWHVIPRNRWCNLYLHQFLMSDDDRALHDHPWASCSIILKGGYYEHLPNGVVLRRKAGQMIWRRAEQAHRVELLPHYEWSEAAGFRQGVHPAWTLFFTGRRVRQWGFYCKQGWRHWRDFVGVPVGEARGDEVGRGCE